MFSPPTKSMTLAFAGLFQAAKLTYQLARLPDYDRDALHHSSYSVLRVDADTTEAAYGSVAALSGGLHILLNLLGKQTRPPPRELLEYAIGMQRLAVKLHPTAAVGLDLEALAARLRHLGDEYLPHYLEHAYDDALHVELGNLYRETISGLSPRILVHSNAGRFDAPLSVHRVRSALFAGIRSAYLWQQLGGRKWQLLLQRKAYCRLARQLLVVGGE